jgi:hypothetical protein
MGMIVMLPDDRFVARALLRAAPTIVSALVGSRATLIWAFVLDRKAR